MTRIPDRWAYLVRENVVMETRNEDSYRQVVLKPKDTVYIV